jgi:hypothetical protein
MKKYFLKFFVVFLTLVSLPFNATAQQGDIMTTFAGAQFIAGINWGLVTATDHSITISNAHLIPMNPSGGPVTFTVEWGKGSPGQNSNNYEFLGTTQPTTLSYSGGDTNYDVNLPGEDNDYYFSITLNNLEPTTNYYFTIHEVNPYEAQPGVTDYGYNLFTYGFVTTDEIPNIDIDFQYSNNNNTVNISGNLETSNGQDLVAENIILQIFEVPPGTNIDEIPSLNNVITSPIITTAAPGSSGGGGYFEHTFDNNVSPGSAYYLLIKRGIDQPNLVFPVYFEVPNLGGNSSTTPPGGGPNFSNATTTGLIPCGSVGQPDCDFDQFIVLINNVVDFLIVFIAFPFVAIVVAWAGILLLTSGGNSSAKEKSKKMIWHVVIGLILALLSWGIIKIILMTLGYQGPLLGIFGIN